MKQDFQIVTDLLQAQSFANQEMDGKPHITFRFRDECMRFELWIWSGRAVISADPEIPMSALPTFEISIPFTELGPVERTGMPTGLGFYAHSPAGDRVLRFSITRREDGRFSLSAMWPGFTQHPLPGSSTPTFRPG